MFYCFLADGFEETEALAPVDILRRADIPVTTVGVTGEVVTSSHHVPVTADMTIDEFEIDDEIRGVILPGGMPGVNNLYANETVKEAVSFCAAHDLFVCAICAAPSIPGRMGLLEGKKATCFPGFEKYFIGAQALTDKTVTDGKFITAKGAGCALDFGFAIVSAVEGEEKAAEIAAAMQC
ncbi:MAG: DJ-1/PfpI family protein [Ruminococcus sp.]|nr:DJ-1/PfpI family protein [Ruminococcus sp.]